MSNMMAQPLWRLDWTSTATQAITAAGHYVAGIYQAIPGKTITKIHAYCTASTSGVVDVQLETVTSANPGYPSGSLVAAGASLLSQSVTASTWHSWTLTTPYAVPTGAVTLVAATLRYASGTTMTFNLRNGSTVVAIPGARMNAGTPTAYAQYPGILIEYSDGNLHPLGVPLVSRSAAAYTSSSNPVEYANRFTAPFNFLCVGIQDYTRMASTTNTAIGQLRIYDSDNNVLTTNSECTINGSMAQSTASTNGINVLFRTPVNLVGGKTYYVARESITASSGQLYYSTLSFPSAAAKAPFFDDVALCYRQTTSSAWTVDTTKLEQLSPLISTAYSSRVCVS